MDVSFVHPLTVPRRPRSLSRRCPTDMRMVAVTRTSSAPAVVTANGTEFASDYEIRASYTRALKQLHAMRFKQEWDNILRLSNSVIAGPMVRCLDARLYAEMFYAMRQRGLKGDALTAYALWDELRQSRQAKSFLSPRVYRCVVQLLCKFNMIQEVIVVRQQGREWNFTLNRFLYNLFLNLCAKASRMDEAFEALQDMAEDQIQPDIVSFNCLIVCCVNAGDLDMALTLMERMRQWPNLRPDLYSFNSIVNGLCKIGRLDDAFAMVARMEIESAHYAAHSDDADPPPPPSPTSAEIDGFHANDSLVFRTPMHCRFAPDVCTYNTLLGGLVQNSLPDLRRALRLKAHMEHRGIKLTEVTYNALMTMAGRGNHIREAFSLFTEMISNGIAPNVECYTTLITLCARAKLVNRAFAIHNHMIAGGIQPTVITFNALISACRHSGDGDRALDTLDAMRLRGGKCEPDVVTYSSVIDALGRAERLSEALQIFDEMRSVGIEPNAVTYTSVVAAQTRGNDLDGAMETLIEMEESDIPANVFTFSSLINGAGRAGKFDLAFDLLEMMRERQIRPTVVTFITLVENAARCGQRRYLNRAIRELGADNVIGRKSDYDAIVEMSKDDLVLKREGRPHLEALVHRIRRSARLNAWGGVANRVPQMRGTRRASRKTVPLKA